MSTQNAEPAGQPSLPQYVVTAAENDWFLRSLVSMVNSSDTTFGITLNVSGMLISGQLVGGKQYFEGFAATFAGAIQDPSEADSIREGFASHGSVYVNTDGTYKQDMEAPSYVHLKNCRYFHPSGNPIPGNGGVWWRGRIREVGGFALGELSSS
ncbi:gas vesicle accessory protein GvpU [Paraburkholderia saeva]|uniref:Gas vesicle protein n=1 Tax=Paraburkholderia saeva TaxID=2777537 RepID=A0A9N8RYC5_9BURK|nr:gas vesicle accessory protein GvpU [Paraburkholderia saeva]CAG4905899.1 hypothetical protein LMG31841_03501 [Paraburkholderia saeva]